LVRCKHCGAEFSLEDWLKEKLPKNYTITQALAEITKWEEQIVTHSGGCYQVGCAEKYGKSGRFTI
jgi:hypothetical protein